MGRITVKDRENGTVIGIAENESEATDIAANYLVQVCENAGKTGFDEVKFQLRNVFDRQSWDIEFEYEETPREKPNYRTLIDKLVDALDYMEINVLDGTCRESRKAYMNLLSTIDWLEQIA